MQLLVLHGAVVADAEASDEPRQGEPLADQGGHDDGEGEEHDKVAEEERRALVRWVNGSASTAASETTPRIPAHPSTTTSRGSGDGSRCSSPGTSMRGR